MAYSRLRGARKFKKKEDETTQANLEAQDAFQERGKKLVDRIMTHPYFVWGTVALIIVIIAASMGVSSIVKKGRDADANEYAEAVKIIESKSGESAEYADEAQKMDKALKAFEKVIENQSGSVSAASAMVYAGKAYQAKNDCDTQESSPTPQFKSIKSLALSFQRRQWQPTPVLLPRESHGRRSLGGYSPMGSQESNTT